MKNEVKLIDLTLKELAKNFNYIDIWKDKDNKLVAEYEVKRKDIILLICQKPLSECVFIKEVISSCDVTSLKLSRILELTKEREDKCLDKNFYFENDVVRIHINLN